jgi:hypothetical protein
MPSPTLLRATLDRLANDFAGAILQAIRSASLEDLLAGGAEGRAGLPRRRTLGPRAHRRPGVRPVTASVAPPTATRRAPLQLDNTLGLVVAALQVGPMRAGEIRQFLKLGRRELDVVLQEGLKTKKIRKKGNAYVAA